MHAEEIVSDGDLVRRLIAAQLPQYDGLAITPVAEFGTDHCLFRLGAELVVRMPRIVGAADQADSDARWLPLLAPHLPVAVPAPLAIGEPGEGFPWHWSVAPWLPGSTPTAYDDSGAHLTAELAAFVRALRDVDATGGPVASGTSRGTPLAGLDGVVRTAIVESGSRIDGPAVTQAWEDALAAGPWARAPVWIHGDLLPGNLLVHDGALSAVIDFGTLAVGDPAPDLLPAWTVLPPGDRDAFRKALGCDDDTWRRGRGWALAPALTGIPYYWTTVPAFAQRGLHTIAAVLDDLG